MTTAKQTPHAAQGTSEPRVNRGSRVIKLAAAVIAVLYLVNGAGAAAGFAKALRAGHESSAHNIAQTVWVGVAWPIVVHDMMRTDPLQRVGTRPELDA